MADIRSTNAELRALAAHTPGSVDLGLSELVARVFATGNAQLRSEDGAELQVERVTTYRALASVLAPRLALEPRLLSGDPAKLGQRHAGRRLDGGRGRLEELVHDLGTGLGGAQRPAAVDVHAGHAAASPPAHLHVHP